MFTQKIRSVFDKVIPNKKKSRTYGTNKGNKFYEVGEKVIYRMYRTEKDIGKLELSSKESIG